MLCAAIICCIDWSDLILNICIYIIYISIIYIYIYTYVQMLLMYESSIPIFNLGHVQLPGQLFGGYIYINIQLHMYIYVYIYIYTYIYIYKQTEIITVSLGTLPV